MGPTPRVQTLVSPDSLEDAKDVKEEVDEVQVEVDRSEDVLLWGQLVHDQVRVKYDETAENHCPCDREDKLQCFAPEQGLGLRGGGVSEGFTPPVAKGQRSEAIGWQRGCRVEVGQG